MAENKGGITKQKNKNGNKGNKTAIRVRHQLSNYQN